MKRTGLTGMRRGRNEMEESLWVLYSLFLCGNFLKVRVVVMTREMNGPSECIKANPRMVDSQICVVNDFQLRDTALPRDIYSHRPSSRSTFLLSLKRRHGHICLCTSPSHLLYSLFVSMACATRPRKHNEQVDTHARTNAFQFNICRLASRVNGL